MYDVYQTCSTYGEVCVCARLPELKRHRRGQNLDLMCCKIDCNSGKICALNCQFFYHSDTLQYDV